MTSFKTKGGTELPLISLKGKPYLQVAHRLVWMREEHPEWSITTECIRMDKDESIFRATICNDAGVVLAQATKREDKAGFADHLEKSETGAIGRALALCGYGTQFCSDELDEGQRLADSPVMPGKTSQPQTNGAYIVPFGKHKGKTLAEIGTDDVRSFGSWLSAQPEKSANATEFLDKAREYLANVGR